MGPRDCVSNMYAGDAEADTAYPVFGDHWPRYMVLKPFLFIIKTVGKEKSSCGGDNTSSLLDISL